MSDITEITGHQLAAARALAGVGADQLAEASKVSMSTLALIEASAGPPPFAASSIAALRAALESAGIEFLAANGGGAGVRLRKPRPEPDSIEGSELNASNDE